MTADLGPHRDDLFDTQGLSDLASTPPETVQTVGDSSHINCIPSLPIYFSAYTALLFLLLCNSGPDFMMALRVIGIFGCIFHTFKYHSECLENSRQTLEAKHFAEKQALEAEHIMEYQHLMDENSAQQRVDNLFETFPEFAEILLAQPHQIESVVLKSDGSPNRVTKSGKKFSKPEIRTGFVVKDGKRHSITLTVSSEG